MSKPTQQNATITINAKSTMIVVTIYILKIFAKLVFISQNKQK